MDFKEVLLNLVSSQVELVSEISRLDQDIIAYLGSLVENIATSSMNEDELLDTFEAYIPHLKYVPKEEFLRWIEQITQHQFNQVHKSSASCSDGGSSENSHLIPPMKQIQASSLNTDINTAPPCCPDCGNPCTKSFTDESVVKLSSLFPDVCRSRLNKILCRTNGNVNEAALFILNNQVKSISIESSSSSSCQQSHLIDKKNPKRCEKKTSKDLLADEKLSADERLEFFERYGFVAESSQPVVPVVVTPSQEKKPCVRYLDGKVVDTKGKKYVEIKPEYPDMPQPTFLKALRRYKFH